MSGAETLSNGFLIIQAGVLLVTVLALLGSMMFAKRSMKASSFMREAREEAHALYGSVERQMQKMQMMSDEMERLAEDMAGRHEAVAQLQANRPAADTASSNETADGDEIAPRQEHSSVDLSAQTEEKKRPGALFRGFLRRR